jgi:hypothetical protein
MPSGMDLLLRKMAKGSKVQFDFISANWIDILDACTTPDDATRLWGFLAQHSAVLNTKAWEKRGAAFRDVVVSTAAWAEYARIYHVAGDAGLGILKELLALCNSSGGIRITTLFADSVHTGSAKTVVVDDRCHPEEGAHAELSATRGSPCADRRIFIGNGRGFSRQSQS